MMCAKHCDSYGAASGKNRGPFFYIRRPLYSVRPLINLRRPLFVVLAGLTASLWITLLLTSWGPVDYEPYRNRRVCLTGTVSGLEPALENDEVIWRLTLANVNLESSGAAGSGSGTIPLERRDRVLCVLDCRPDLDMSARVRVRGNLTPFRFARNEGEFDSRLYYHILRTAFSLRDVRIEASSGPTDHLAASLYRLKRLLAAVIDLVFPDRTAPVLQAILLGEKGLLGSETKDLYQGAGIIHILSISGLHLSLIGMGFFTLFGKIGMPVLPRAAGALAFIFSYGKMIGTGTSVFRAMVMLTLYIVSKVIGRTYDLMTAAGLAAALLIIDQPLYLLHTGFQFSFAAVLSIGVLMPALPGKGLKALAVPLGTLPVSLWINGTFPVYSLLLNLLVIPLMPAVMVSGAGAVLAGCLAMTGQPFSATLNTGSLIPAAVESAGAGDAGLLSAAVESAGAGDAGLLSAAAVTAGDGNAGLISVVAGTAGAGNAGIFQAGAGAFFLSAARLIGIPADLVLRLYRFLAELTAALPGHAFAAGRPAPLQILIYYLLLSVMAGISVFLQMPPARRRIERGILPDRTLPKGERRIILLAQRICAAARLRDNRERRRFGVLCSAAWILICLGILLVRFPPGFQMDFLYVGQGDGILISSEGRYFLVDGGSSSEDKLARYTLEPFLYCRGISALDGVILTHDDLDHCSGLLGMLEAARAGQKRITIRAIYLPEIADAAKGKHFLQIEKLTRTTGVPLIYLSRGQRIRLGRTTLDCLHPERGAAYEDANAYSTTLLVSNGSFRALLTGDLEGQGEKDLLDYLEGQGGKELLDYLDGQAEENPLDCLEGQGEENPLNYLEGQGEDILLDSTVGKHKNSQEKILPIAVLKVAHHGSRFASSDRFLHLVRPEISVISVGARNIYGHPSEEVLERLTSPSVSSTVYRTDLQGGIIIRYNKEKDSVRVKTFLDSQH